MANKRISQLDEYTGSLSPQDLFVFVRNATLSTQKITYANFVFSSNTTLSSGFVTLNTTSGSWNSVYSNVNASSAAWNSVYTTTNSNSAIWNSVYTTVNNNSARYTTIDYLSTTNVLIKGATITDGLSAQFFATEALSSRQINLIHIPANDGTNPVLSIGETGSQGFSGFNISYDEIQNILTITSVFSGVSSSAITIDRNGNANSPFLPYTVTLSKFISAAGPKSGFWPAALSGVIPASEITSRIREGKGMIRGSFLFSLSCSSGNIADQNVRLDFSSNPNFTSSVSIFSNGLTPNGTTGLASILKVFEGYVIDNAFVFPGNSTNPYGASTSSLTNHGPYTNDLYYRAGFNIVAPAGSIGFVNASLSGGSISIIP